MSPEETLADALSGEMADAAPEPLTDATGEAGAPLAPVIDRRDPRVALAVAGIALAAALVGGLVALVISFSG
ncbi:hypothetical protein [Intrasporangium sp. YIM S08009]|uniref:hypothetical protein n=1 Tax=Intrasporangium zincisolvens TaxID=3080018 RepID=UPI002B05277C|nr:hypothetical protein [Intrasporangium sp. YIM S08009]